MEQPFTVSKVEGRRDAAVLIDKKNFGVVRTAQEMYAEKRAAEGKPDYSKFFVRRKPKKAPGSKPTDGPSRGEVKAFIKRQDRPAAQRLGVVLNKVFVPGVSE